MKKGRTVQEAKRYEIYSCTPETKLREAAARLVAEDISALVVLDEAGGLAGVISRIDLVRAYLATDAWAAQCVADHMTRDVYTVNVTDRLSDVAHLLLNHHIHRAVVMKDKRPVSVISSTDLVYYMVNED